MKDTSVLTQGRWDNMTYLQETCSQFDDGQALLEEIVGAMASLAPYLGATYFAECFKLSVA